ncbi:tRNA-dependent cyclodipeptide synthase [Streptomyces sp. NRRL B-24085]|uniref:tRNA-dependent cyclodipeptide synthase n=1 Tax=Streptomyces sp. NRRL B-24085 TaxID=1709476 RepID=UPI0006B3C0B7|nr:tRNA-dependent cyclodipeptide synthase [Streptomyces sp. NRRL B-24085]
MHDWAMPTASAPPTAARRGNGFLAMRFSERCAGLVDDGHRMFLGVSPGNGYVSENQLVALLPRAAAHLTRVDVAHPGTGTVACTCPGRGYEPRHARAYRDVRRTANRISRAVTTARTDPARPGGAKFSDFYDNPAHPAAFARVSRAHQGQRAFHATCTRRVTGALRPLMPADRTPTADQLTDGGEHLDRELPFPGHPAVRHRGAPPRAMTPGRTRRNRSGKLGGRQNIRNPVWS